MQCQAKAKSTGKQCNRRAVEGKRVCTVHGGLTPGGRDSANFKHGRYSKYIPKELDSRYRELLSNPNLLSLKDEIAMSQARTAELFEQLNANNAGQDWQDLSEVWEDLRRAMSRNDPTSANAAAQEIDLIIRAGSNNIGIWNKINESMDNTRKLVQAEAKMLTDMRMVITVERAMAFAYAIIDIVRRRLTEYMDEGKPPDKVLLSSISGDVRKLTSLPERVTNVTSE